MKYRIIRQRRRSLGLRVTQEGEIEVRAPLRCTRAQVEDALRRREAWLCARLAQVARARAVLDAPPEELPLLGMRLPVQPAPDGRVRLDAERGVCCAPPGAALREIRPELEQEYRRVAREVIPPRVQRWAQAFGLEVRTVRITGARQRWGSCSASGGLCFSWRLVLASPGAIDAVVIHELMHRVQFNHSPAFRRLERENTPRYEACQAELRELARQMDVWG